MEEPEQAPTTKDDSLDVQQSSADQRPVRGWQVGQWLLANNFLLSALELLVEAQEVGKEAEVEGLKNFFSNPDMFPPEELAKHNPEDALNLQRFAKEREERLAIVEYELRIAKEDLAQLQSTNAAPSISRQSAEAVDEREPSSNDLPLQERRQLNQAVRHYLASTGYKLSALTFSEEAAYATPPGEPAEEETLANLLEGCRQKQAALAAADTASAAQAVARKEADCALARLQGVQDMLEAARKENRLLGSELDAQQEKVAWLTEKLQEAERNENEARRAVREGGKVSLPAPVAGQQQKDATPTKERSHSDSVLLEVAKVIPKLVPHMLINARVDLLPLFMTLIQELKDRGARDTLAHALFNVVKKPTGPQRQMISEAMAELATRIGPARTAEELLPQCWEQVGHKHTERRITVAECCGRLVGAVSVDMRQSLLLSMLQQLATDKEAAVQAAVANSLALLLPELPDLDKYQAVEGILLALVRDRHSSVLAATEKSLLPALLAWIDTTDLLHASLIPAVLSSALKTLSQCPLLGGVNEEAVKEGEPGLRVIGNQQQQQVEVLLRVFVALLKPLQVAALQKRPAWAWPDGLEGIEKQPAAVVSQANGSEDFAQQENESAGQIGGSHSGEGPADAAAEKLQNRDESESNFSHPLETSTTASAVESFEDPLGALTQNSQADGTSRASVDDSEADGTSTAAASDVRDAQSQNTADDSHGHLQSASTPLEEKDLVDQASKADSLVFASWLNAESPDEWEIVSWLLNDALPSLLNITRMIPPQDQTEGLRRRVCTAIQALCKTFGEDFTKGAIVPLFMAAAALQSFSAENTASPVVASLAASLTPERKESTQVGRTCIFPQLLAGALPCVGSGALADLLRLLTMEAGDEDAWALAFPQEMANAVHFAAAFDELQGQLLAFQWELTSRPSAVSRMCAAKLASAFSSSLSQSLLRRQVLPALIKLANDQAVEVKINAIEALANLWQLFSSSPSQLEELHRHLDSLMSSGIHEVELAIVSSLSSKARVVTHAQLEFILQKLLLLLASMHQRAAAGRSPRQLKEAAATILDALSSIASCEIVEQKVSLHLLAALQALRRESELLEPMQREKLDQLTRQQAAATPAMSSPERAVQLPSRSPLQAQRPELTSISSPDESLRASSRAAQPWKQSQAGSRDSRRPDTNASSRDRKGNSIWRESGKAVLRSMSGNSGPQKPA